MGSFASPFFKRRGGVVCQGICAERGFLCRRACPPEGTVAGNGDRILGALKRTPWARPCSTRGAQGFRGHALNEAATSDFFRGRVILDQLLELLLKYWPTRSHCQQFSSSNDRQIFQADTASQRTPTKSGAVLYRARWPSRMLPARKAPSGTPAAIGFAIATMSGTTPKA